MPVSNPPTYREQCTKVVGFDAATCDYLCDGTADEVQINAAITAVVALGGGCVALQRGTYDVRASIVMGSEVWLKGSGFDTVLLRSTANFDVITATSKTKCIISDFYLNGATTATHGIYFNGTTYSIIRHVYIVNMSEAIHLLGSSDGCQITDNIIGASSGNAIYVASGYYCIVQRNFIYTTGGVAVYLASSYHLCVGNIVYGSTGDVANTSFQVSTDSTVTGNLSILDTAVAVDGFTGGGRTALAGNIAYGGRKGFSITGNNASVVNNMVYACNQDGITFSGDDSNITGNSVLVTGKHGIYLTSCYRSVCSSNIVNSPDKSSTNTYDGINVTNSSDCILSGNLVTDGLGYNVRDGIRLLGTSEDNVICNNRIRGYDIGINVSVATCNRNLVKNNVLLNNTVVFADSGIGTKLASVIVSFVDGTDPQDSGFLVDSTNGGDDFARAYTMLPVEVQQVVRAKVYARSVVAETHSMEADFTVYGAADNEPYNTHDGSAASLGSTSVNFAADDVVYWALTAAGLLAMLGKDNVQVKVDYAAADGDNCATNAYFRTVEIEYV